MRYLLSIQNDESVPLPVGADWDASLVRIGAVDDEMRTTGFWVIDVADQDEAPAWAEKCAEACWGPIEVRPFDALSQN